MRKNNTQNEKQKSVAFKKGQEYKILPSVNETKTYRNKVTGLHNDDGEWVIS